ncbi:MAG: hypothetical protein AB1324_02875 [Candidatus Micrarchaeota archaeon]
MAKNADGPACRPEEWAGSTLAPGHPKRLLQKRTARSMKGLVEGPASIPCNGNGIQLPSGGLVTDRELAAVLAENSARPLGERLSHNDGWALARFRKTLSAHGPGAFEEREIAYLEAIIRRFHGEAQPSETAEDREERNLRKRAYFKYRELDRQNMASLGVARALLRDGAVDRAVREVALVLEPFGLSGSAGDIVARCARKSFRILDDELSSVPYKKWRNYLFTRLLNPARDEYRRTMPFIEAELNNLPERLRIALEVVQPGSDGVKEEIEYVIACSGSVSVDAVQGGSPGSGRGGTDRS